MSRRRVVYIVVGVLVLVAVALSSLAAIPSGGTKGAQIPIPYSATTLEPIMYKLAPDGLAPKDVIDSVLAPVGYSVVKTANLNLYGSTFDKYADLRVHLSPSQVSKFYQAALQDAGWSIQKVQAIAGGDEIVASRAGSDGFYWEVGIKDPIAKAISGSIVQVRLIQISFS